MTDAHRGLQVSLSLASPDGEPSSPAVYSEGSPCLRYGAENGDPRWGSGMGNTHEGTMCYKAPF